MWKIAIKVISGIYTKYLSGWRIFAFLGLVFGSYILSLKAETWNAERKLASANKEIKKLKADSIEAQDANKTTNESLTTCLKTNKELTRQGVFNQVANDQAIEDINKYAVKQDKKILELKSKIKPDTDCSLEYVSDNTIKLLKEANNQN